MTVTPSIDPARLLEEQLAQASPDLLRELLTTFINTLMSAEADAVCGAAYGHQLAGSGQPAQRVPGPGVRHPGRHPGPGGPEAARQGTYFPEWLLERRKRAERALTSVVATCYLLGVSTRRMDKLVQTLGITTLSKSQVSEMAKDLDAHVEEFRTRRLEDAGPFTFVAADALVLKVREGGRVVGVHALVATGVNADGHREILGLQVTTAEDGAGWLGFFRDLTARGLSRRQAGHLRRPRRPGRRDRRDPARRLLATLPHPLRREPDVGDPEVQLGLGQGPAAQRLRPTRRRSRARPVRPRRRRPDREAPERGRAPRARPHRHPGLHRRSPRRSGDRSGPTTPTNASTARSAAAPTSSGSSPTAARSSDSSAPSWPSSTTNGPKDAATSASTSSRNHRPSTPTPRR